MIERGACAACGSMEIAYPPPIAPEWPLAQCTACGFLYLPFSPPYCELNETLAWEKTSAAETQRRRKRFLNRIDQATRWRMQLGHGLDFLRRKRSLGLTGNVLDIGCGGSCRVPNGPTPFGIEISRALAESAKAHFVKRSGTVVHGPAIDGLKAFADGFFASVLMRSYLEHEAAPFEVLSLVRAKLGPGGMIYVRVPNHASLNRRIMGARWCGYRFPDHVNYFTPKTLRLMAGRADLTYRRINWLSPFDDNIIAELVKPHASHSGEDDSRHDDGRLHVVVR